MTKRKWQTLGLIISILLLFSFFIVSINILSVGEYALAYVRKTSIIAALLYDWSSSFINGSFFLPLFIINLFNIFWIPILIFSTMLISGRQKIMPEPSKIKKIIPATKGVGNSEVAFILSIVGIFFGIVQIPALILGIISYNHSQKGTNDFKMSVAAICISSIYILLVGLAILVYGLFSILLQG